MLVLFVGDYDYDDYDVDGNEDGDDDHQAGEQDGDDVEPESRSKARYAFRGVGHGWCDTRAGILEGWRYGSKQHIEGAYAFVEHPLPHSNRHRSLPTLSATVLSSARPKLFQSKRLSPRCITQSALFIKSALPVCLAV
jgi:hypothetical protein